MWFIYYVFFWFGGHTQLYLDFLLGLYSGITLSNAQETLLHIYWMDFWKPAFANNRRYGSSSEMGTINSGYFFPRAYLLMSYLPYYLVFLRLKNLLNSGSVKQSWWQVKALLMLLDCMKKPLKVGQQWVSLLSGKFLENSYVNSLGFCWGFFACDWSVVKG